ncbi:MAG: 50S ribosomal protein L3 [Alphaproteobacteria bacterium]|nr:50S ribosomal protein L3 [Alphaproteobacteria bacterium]
MRHGLLAQKLGMTQVYEDGAVVPVTVLSFDAPRVVGHRNMEKDGYTAVQIGMGNKHHPNKSEQGKVADGDAAPTYVREFRVSSDSLDSMAIGTSFDAKHFSDTSFVDVASVARGKGFAGVMKRHGFKGLRATHGVSVSHRSHGSTGNCQEPGKVFKGKKMAGHMGNKRVTKQSLRVIRIDETTNTLLVKGAVPGGVGTIVEVSDAIKRR